LQIGQPSVQALHGCHAPPRMTRQSANPYLTTVDIQPTRRVMSNNTKHSFFREVLSTMGHALAVAAAVQRNAAPEPKRLFALGIDPAEYQRIKRYY
jgi:hypothetical protein